jgi:3-hydroxyisobutyrate dehydrogenase-like beta-hydroxyacid dehydrogenase
MAVTVLGLGEMGSALAGAFLGGGLPTTVWNRSPGKADALVAKGAVGAASAEGPWPALISSW